MLVAHQLKKMKENRRKYEEQQKLKEVLDRVQAAIDYSGSFFYCFVVMGHLVGSIFKASENS